MNSKIRILNPGVPLDYPSQPSLRIIRTTRGVHRVLEHLPQRVSHDPIDIALSAITDNDFLPAIEKSSVLGKFVQKYPKNWHGIISHRYLIDKMLVYIQESLLSNRVGRAGFDPEYIKILLFIQDKYNHYKQHSSR